MSSAEPVDAAAPATDAAPKPFDRMLFARRAFAAAGLALLVYGVARLFLLVAWGDLLLLLIWMVGAVAVHDGLLSPLVLGVGAALRRLVPDRARRYLQGGLITGAMVTVVAVPMIYLEGSQPPEKAILLQRYGVNLSVVLLLVAAVSLALYALRVARDRRSAGGVLAQPEGSGPERVQSEHPGPERPAPDHPGPDHPGPERSAAE